MVLVCVCAERLQASRLPSDRDKTCVRTHWSVRTLGLAESDFSSGGGGGGCKSFRLIFVSHDCALFVSTRP